MLILRILILIYVVIVRQAAAGVVHGSFYVFGNVKRCTESWLGHILCAKANVALQYLGHQSEDSRAIVLTFHVDAGSSSQLVTGKSLHLVVPEHLGWRCLSWHQQQEVTELLKVDCMRMG